MAATLETANGAAATAQLPVPAQVVGNAFVQQYYHILQHSPELAYRFYQDISTLGRPAEDGSMSVTTTMQGINEKIASLNYGDFSPVIKSVDSLESFNGGFQVLVIGGLTAKDNTVRNFSQAFFLAPQDRGYFVLNDVFRYLNDIDQNAAIAEDVTVPVTLEQVPAPVLENRVSEQIQSTTSTEELTPEVQNPLENGGVPIAEEVSVAEDIDEMPRDVHMVVKSSVKIEAPKKSYASIVKHFKESSATSFPPAATPGKEPPKGVEQANHNPISAPEAPVSSSETVDVETNQEGEADGCSIYLRGLPTNATEDLIEEVFKKFGTIKMNGIQIKNNWQQGFMFGFVEFDNASSVQKATEASPVAIGGRRVIVEEKRSTYTRGSYRGRFQSQRGSGFRNDGNRGRGNAPNNNRGGRSDFTGNRGGGTTRGVVSSNRDDGFQNKNNVDYRAKNVPPRVSATA